MPPRRCRATGQLWGPCYESLCALRDPAYHTHTARALFDAADTCRPAQQTCIGSRLFDTSRHRCMLAYLSSRELMRCRRAEQASARSALPAEHLAPLNQPRRPAAAALPAAPACPGSPQHLSTAARDPSRASPNPNPCAAAAPPPYRRRRPADHSRSQGSWGGDADAWQAACCGMMQSEGAHSLNAAPRLPAVQCGLVPRPPRRVL